MKYGKKTLSIALTVLALGAFTADIASAHHRPAPPHRPGYGDGFLDGLIVSSMAVLLSHSLSHAHYKQLVLMGADEEAAAFLAGDAAPSALLQEAMKIERSVLDMAGADVELSDEDVAILIMKRAAQF